MAHHTTCPSRGSAHAAAVALLIACAAGTSRAQEAPLPRDLQPVAEAFGVQGEMKADENVYTTSFPRSDLSVAIDGEPVPTALGFASWVAFRPGADETVAMSDMVLLPDEIGPVISTLEDAGVEVTALHRHFQGEQPQLMFLHSHARGEPAKIASGYRAALEKTSTPLRGNGAGRAGGADGEETGPAIDTAAVARTVGHAGEVAGGVYKITVGRDDLRVEALGTEVTKSMGLNSWAAFVGTDDLARVAGDIAMLESEVNPVLRALRTGGIEIVSVHNHMLGEEPRIFFLHYWGSGPAQELARSFRAALDQLGGS